MEFDGVYLVNVKRATSYDYKWAALQALNDANAGWSLECWIDWIYDWNYNLQHSEKQSWVFYINPLVFHFQIL